MASTEQEPATADMSISTDELIAILRERISTKFPNGSVAARPQALFPLTASEFEPLECYPWRREIGCRDSIGLLELVNAPNDRIVPRLYHIIFQREPSSGELMAASSRLEKGSTTLELAIRLRVSKEGRRVGIQVRGIFGVGVGQAILKSVARRVLGMQGKRL